MNSSSDEKNEERNQHGYNWKHEIDWSRFPKYSRKRADFNLLDEPSIEEARKMSRSAQHFEGISDARLQTRALEAIKIANSPWLIPNPYNWDLFNFEAHIEEEIGRATVELDVVLYEMERRAAHRLAKKGTKNRDAYFREYNKNRGKKRRRKIEIDPTIAHGMISGTAIDNEKTEEMIREQQMIIKTKKEEIEEIETLIEPEGGIELTDEELKEYLTFQDSLEERARIANAIPNLWEKIAARKAIREEQEEWNKRLEKRKKK